MGLGLGFSGFRGFGVLGLGFRAPPKLRVGGLKVFSWGYVVCVYIYMYLHMCIYIHI